MFFLVSKHFFSHTMDLQEEHRLERAELLKGMHPKMRAFWSSVEAEVLHEKYGKEFPAFWQDLDTWVHLKPIQKVFLIVCEKKESGKSVSREDVTSIEASLAGVVEGGGVMGDETAGAGADGQRTGDDQAPKKRRNRWQEEDQPLPGHSVSENVSGQGPNVQNSTDGIASSETTSGTEKKSRRSRWGGDALSGIASLGACVLHITQEVAQQTTLLKIQLQQINDRLQNVSQEAALIEQDPNRPPSPAPKYDKDGKRTNTREVRMREDLTKERSRLMDELVKLNPQFQPPVDMLKLKPTRKVFIPFREFPNYNFIGLILGPRGNTHKKMEQETGCKISIRGKGSMKEASKGRSSQSEVSAEDEDLHVLVTGDNDENLELAVKMVEDLLRPIDDEKNDHKQKQLRELALINGTLRDDEYCPVCGEKGHRQFECPHRAKSFKATGVKCSICGDLSHPTRDCPLKTDDSVNAIALDSEYDSFIAELDGRQSPRADGALCQPVTRSAAVSNTDITALSDDYNIQNAPKRQQTVIHVTSVMTGLAPPPLVPSSGMTSATAGGSSTALIPPAASVTPNGTGLWGGHEVPRYSHSVPPPGIAGYYGSDSGISQQHGYPSVLPLAPVYNQGAYAYPQMATLWEQQPPLPFCPPPPPIPPPPPG